MKNEKLCYCGSKKPYGKCCAFLDEIKKEYSHIIPHDYDANVGWYGNGCYRLNFDDLDENELKKKEEFFKKLIQFQPQHHDSFHALAMIYRKRGERDKTIYFYDQAIKRAKEFLKDDSIDPIVIEKLEEEREEAVNNKK